MASASGLVERVGGERLARARRTTVAVCFGDAFGLTLFLGSLAFFVLTWRAGVFINDISVFVALLERVADGHLSLGRVGGIGDVNPGMYYVGETVYGRNYGQVVLSLPAYWLVETLGPLALKWVVVVGWSLLVFAVAARAGTHLGRRRVGLAVGAGVAVLALVANAVTFRSFYDDPAVIALQLTAMVVAALTGVFCYRLVSRQRNATLGLLAGGTVVLATPVGFWATVPKRHAFTATLVVVALYALARSRGDTTGARLGSAGFRGAAYACAGLLAWIHAPEGFTLFLALAVVDLPTAPDNDRRTLAVVGGAFLLSLVPFFLTNYLISGNPVQPPRFLPRYLGPSSLPGGEATGASEAAGGGAGTTTGSPTEGWIAAVVPTALLSLLGRGFGTYARGATLVVTDPERLITVFLRWGRHGYDPGGIFFGGGTNLSVVESAPVLAAAVVAPVARAVEAVRTRRFDLPLTVVDAFALVLTALFVALYLSRLPVKVMLTVRYLHPVYPLAVYLLFRQRWLTDVLETRPRVALWGYEAAVLLGTPLVVGALVVLPAGNKGGVVQAYGLVSLVTAGLLVAAGVAVARDRLDPRVGAVTAGVAAGVGSVFLLVTALVLMHYGPSALPAVEAGAGEIRFAILRYG